MGYRTQEVLALAPSRVDVNLTPLKVEVGQAEVIAPRDLGEIVRDIQALGYREDFRLSGVNAIQSPITFLYESLAREAKSRREVARLENDDRRRALLQELFVSTWIIKLSTSSLVSSMRLLGFVTQAMTV